MANFILPPASEKTYPKITHFPTKMQTLVFRMWDMVPKEKLAEVLETETKNIEDLACGMGLLPQGDCTQWQKRGYISIIKNAWLLLPYDQLCTLLGWDYEKLSFILREDDFLGYKLGDEKPKCEKITYRPLTESEKAETEKIKSTVSKYIKISERKPFDFFKREETPVTISGEVPQGCTLVDCEWGIEDLTKSEETKHFIKLFEDELYNMFGYVPKGNGRKIRLILKSDLQQKGEYHEIECKESGITVTAFSPVGILRALMRIVQDMRTLGGPYVKNGRRQFKEKIKTRYIYSFCGLYSNAFEEAPAFSYPDELLRRYAHMGINGVFTQGVLYKLTPFPFNTDISAGWEKQLDGVKKTVQHLKKYGIKLYLYLNEPRSMPIEFFKNHPELMGREMNGYAALCTSVPAVKKYLHDAVHRLCSEVPDIGGFVLITCSENLTNCYSHVHHGKTQPCKRCVQRKNYEVIAEVHNLVNRAAKSVNKNITTFANTWQWLNAFSEEETKKCIELLDKDIPLLCTSEEGLRFNCGGIENTVQDYTMSKVGPSVLSKKTWDNAQKAGHDMAAKVQINTTWECSTVPFIPVFDLVREHMERLDKIGIKHLMLSWTLGGYPSDNLKTVSEFYFEEETKKSENEMLAALYGNDAKKVKKAAKLFCEAFSEFPFDVMTAYTGPHNAGVSNLLYESPTKLKATMTCFCYDDIESWRGVYPAEIYEKQLMLLFTKWKEGAELIKDMPDCDFKYMAQACLAIFSSCVNQVRFIRLRDENKEENKEEIRRILENETENAENMYSVMQKCPAIGFEAANHYYYTQAMMLEKILNCKYLIEKLCG